MKQDAQIHEKGCKNVRKYAVLIEWTDGEVADADEMPTWAKSAAEAKRKAKTVWSATKGAEYPHCRIEKVLIVTKRMMRDVA